MTTRSKLAVILHADVVGSTALVQKDERLAHERIREAFRQFSETIVRYGGIAHEVRGDALVSEFNRASDAVSAGLAFQAENRTRNQVLSGEVRPEVRIGIALGEVIIADQTVTGAGVVLAQRLEQLADAGGVCVQSSVKESVPNRFPFNFEDIGDQSLKGFDEPVRAFSVVLKADEQVPSPEPPGPSKAEIAQRPKRRLLAAAVVALLLVASGLTAWLEPWNVKPASSDQPSIAVLAFSNLSKDPEQDYFGEGIAEDIITDLSKISDLLVIARNSSFSYLGKNVPIRTIAKELGVKYVLEGSVRRDGDALRINAQLIDAETDGHLWAERYDGKSKEVFALQDRITKEIVTSLSIKLSAKSQRNLGQTPTVNPEAYDAFLRGMRQLSARAYGEAGHVAKARKEFQIAVELDPSFARAYAGLGWSYWSDYANLNQLDRSLKVRAFELAEKSLALTDNTLARRLRAKQFFAPDIFGVHGLRPKRPAEAISELRMGVALEPNNADALAELAYTLVFAGEPQEATDLIRKAMRLNPNFPAWYHRPAGIAHYLNGNYPAAVREFKAWYESEALKKESIPWLAAAYAQSGDIPLSHEIINEISQARTWSFVVHQQWFANRYVFVRDQDRERFIDGLRKAGLPSALDD